MHTNNTSHYNLPQFIGSDIPNPLTDWNDSMQDIDAAMYEIKTQADEIGSDIVEDESDISDLQSQANLTDDNITLLNQQTTAARTAATDAQDAANRNASNITTLQQSVANNRTSITQYNNRFNQNVPFAFGIVEEEDPDNPGTMIEKYGYYTDDDPAEFVAFGEAAEKFSGAIFAAAYGPRIECGVLGYCNNDYVRSNINPSNGLIPNPMTITVLKSMDINIYGSIYLTGSSSVSVSATVKGHTYSLNVSSALNQKMNTDVIHVDPNDTIVFNISAPAAQTDPIAVSIEKVVS